MRCELEHSGQLPGVPPYGMANPSWNESQLCGPCQEAFLINQTRPSQTFGSSPCRGQAGGHLNIPHIQNSVHSKLHSRLLFLETGIQSNPPSRGRASPCSRFVFLRSPLSELPAMKENVSCGHGTGRRLDTETELEDIYVPQTEEHGPNMKQIQNTQLHSKGQDVAKDG